MICLITGHDGFIGRYLKREIEALGFAAHGLETRGEPVDLVDRDAVEAAVSEIQPEIVYHLGGISGPMLALDNHAAIIRVNCEGTLNILNSCLRQGVKRLIYASSVAAFAYGLSSNPLPDSIYGATKRFGELLTDYFTRTSPIESTSIRIGSVFGVGRQTDNPIHTMVQSALENGTVSYRDALLEPSICVEDCARMLAGLAAVKKLRDRYDAVAYAPLHKEIAMEVAELTGATLVRARRHSAAQPNYPIEFDISSLAGDTGRDVEVTLRAGITRLIDDLRGRSQSGSNDPDGV